MNLGRIGLFIVAPLLILMLPLAVYLTDRSMSDGTLPRNVSIAGIDVAGLPPDEAFTVVRSYEESLYAEPSAFVVNGTTYELNPNAVGMKIDVDSALSAATAESSHGVLDGLIPWFRSFSTELDIPVEVSIDGTSIDHYLEVWELAAIPEPAFDGNIEIVDGEVLITYPTAGMRIDRIAARNVVESAMLDGVERSVDIPLVDRRPVLSNQEFDEAAAAVETMISRPVTLHSTEADTTLIVLRSELAAAVTIDIVTTPPAHIDVGLDPDILATTLESRLAEFERPPVEVQIATNVATGRASVTLPENGTRVDADALTEALHEAALTGGRGDLPIVTDVEPRITAEQVEAWGPLGLVSSFTTRHAAGQPRVTNIQTMARTVDDSIVWPGETFSINEKVGQRTEAKGYVRDAAIINGEVYCCDSPVNVGGGVSQFGTTFFNAVFFGGYEDIEHRPHSIYFSKYPEGREATLGYLHPDVIFRNNTDAPVIIRTAYTATSITVLFFGNNGGLKVASVRSDRRNFTEPRVIYEENTALSPGTQRVVTSGSEGWTVTVTRVITHPDGSVEREPFYWSYRGSAKKIQVASCATVSGSARCTSPPSTTPPTTAAPTTTTLPEETTSTTEAPTTTTAPTTTSSTTTTTSTTTTSTTTTSTTTTAEP
ncbi:MAG: VanW family protein [Acidimicrobiia bacterium]